MQVINYTINDKRILYSRYVTEYIYSLYYDCCVYNTRDLKLEVCKANFSKYLVSYKLKDYKNTNKESI